MIVKEWKRKIKKAYLNNNIDITIQILSEALSRRDKAKELYIELGDSPLIKDSLGNYIKNPAIEVLQECDLNILPYLEVLGLTKNKEEIENKQEDKKQNEIKIVSLLDKEEEKNQKKFDELINEILNKDTGISEE